ncbi:phage gp6-like head-tail connector protein [Kitasatospora sp. NPDC057500]|uniref:phage gp6-like head-tail connector protein n=1 Tax=Kitasatospora sp. NPDC057500 TaxID=3346151 RepID=UPI0036A4AB61
MTDPVYVPLGTLKSALKITDTDRDDLLTQALQAASRGVEKIAGRRFWLDPAPVARILNPRGRTLDDADGGHLLTADIGTLDGLVVETGTTGAWSTAPDIEPEPTDALDEGRPVTSLLRLGAPWPAGARQRVRVTARWGWPAVPDEVAQATLIQANRLFRRKDSPDGVAGSAEWGVMRLGRVDPDVDALMKPFVLPGMA